MTFVLQPTENSFRWEGPHVHSEQAHIQKHTIINIYARNRLVFSRPTRFIITHNICNIYLIDRKCTLKQYRINISVLSVYLKKLDYQHKYSNVIIIHQNDHEARLESQMSGQY